MEYLQAHIFIFLLIIYPGQMFAQSDSTTLKERQKKNNDNRAHFIFSDGFFYQRQLLGEIGLIYGYSSQNGLSAPGGIAGVKIATEFNFDEENFLIAPKLCAEIAILIFGARINFIDYTNVTYHLCMLPND